MRVIIISKRQKELNDDLGAYLAKKHGTQSSERNFLNIDFSFLKFSSDDNVPEVPVTESTVYEEKRKPSLLSVFFAKFRSSKEQQEALDDVSELPADVAEEVEEVEDEIEHVEGEVKELEEEREGLLQRLFSLFRRSRSREPDFEEEPEDVSLSEEELLKQETREALHMIHKWIGRLPPEQINAFKRSPDFQKYKDLLQKYNLIK